MSNGWDQAEGLMKKHATSNSGLFVKLASHGDKIVGAFVGAPYPREVHWIGERYDNCSGEGWLPRVLAGRTRSPSSRRSVQKFLHHPSQAGSGSAMESEAGTSEWATRRAAGRTAG